MSYLPPDILTSIFLQLPTKSIGQCKCVCKSWRSLISNPEFVKLHLGCPFQKKKQLGLFLVHPLPPLGSDSCYGFGNIDINRDADLLVHPLPPLGSDSCYGFENIDINRDADLLDSCDLGGDYKPPQIDVEIVGSSNGLICLLYFPNRFVLWNPTIKDSTEIPNSPDFVDDYVMLFYGFYYDSFVDDYNLVRNLWSTSKSTSIFEIYSLKSNSWRRAEYDSNFINIDIETKVGTFLNGALHWVASRGINQTNNYKRYDVIVVFDIKRDKFYFWEIVAPQYDRCYELKLGVLDGCLSLYSYEEVTVILIWVMKEYDLSESWTLLTNLSLNQFFYCDYVKPVCYARDDELILDVDGQYLVRYQLKDWDQLLLKFFDIDWFSPVCYIESLVSPKSYFTINN